MSKQFTLFNPDSDFDFVGRRHLYYALTGIGILGSIIALATLGFNKGIDFKGGTKQIIAFKQDAQVDRVKLRATVDKILANTLGAGAKVGEVEVQEFDTGSGGGGGKKHFAVVTETTSVLTQAKKDAIALQIKATLSPTAEIEWTAEGEDRVFVTLQEPKKLNEAYDGLRKAFAASGMAKVKTSSDLEVQADINLFRQLEMSQAEGTKELAALNEQEKKLRAEKETDLAEKTDRRFTVVVEEFKDKLENGIKAEYGAKFIAVESSTAVSPSVAGEMMSQGLVAILYAILGIVLYIILRFDVRYAPGALIATVHDVILVIGAFSVAQVKFSMPVIAAVLTVAGYSVTDTIVVFDRIREMQEKHPGVAIDKLINSAINATMSRTVLTSLTTFMTSAAIFLFGGGLIRDFAFAMCIGVIVGTFSSIFVASPVFLALHKRFEARKAANVLRPGHSTEAAQAGAV